MAKLQTGKVEKIHKEHKFGVIIPDDGNGVVLFEKRSIQSVDWEKLRKNVKVSFNLPGNQPSDNVRFADLVTVTKQEQAVIESLSRGMKRGKIACISKEHRFGRIEGEERMFVSFAETRDGKPVADDFDQLSVGQLVEYQDFEVFTNTRVATKITRILEAATEGVQEAKSSQGKGTIVKMPNKKTVTPGTITRTDDPKGEIREFTTAHFKGSLKTGDSVTFTPFSMGNKLCAKDIKLDNS